MLILLLDVAVLIILMKMLAKNEADINWPKALLIFVPAIIGIAVVAKHSGSADLAILIYLAAIAFLLKVFFYTTLIQALSISILFVVYRMAYSYFRLSDSV